MICFIETWVLNCSFPPEVLIYSNSLLILSLLLTFIDSTNLRISIRLTSAKKKKSGLVRKKKEFEPLL